LRNGGTKAAHSCGIQTAWTEAQDPSAAVAEVAGAIDRSRIAQLLIFFSPDYDVAELTAALETAFSGIAIAGCSTSGGITPEGWIEQGLVLIAFPLEGFRISSTCLEDIGHLDVASAASSVRAMRRALDQRAANRRGQRFAISLIDALTNVEETVVSTIAWALDGIPLVGGSAGDALTFRDTVMIYNGAVLRNAAILLLVETDFQTKLFKTDNFEPTKTKFVVTGADDGTRTIHELNAEPAAREYATAVGLDPQQLSPMSFASHPLTVKIDGEYFCRSIRHLNTDGSLTFFCAVDEGMVLTLAQPRDIVDATREELDRVEAALGELDIIIGFDCILRRLDAEARQVRKEIAALYCRYNVVGFETYGEQYRSMHLNQTFTGIAIGQAAPV
jgi:hypothetical protein